MNQQCSGWKTGTIPETSPPKLARDKENKDLQNKSMPSNIDRNEGSPNGNMLFFQIVKGKLTTLKDKQDKNKL